MEREATASERGYKIKNITASLRRKKRRAMSRRKNNG
jgi:hypothetical protein